MRRNRDRRIHLVVVAFIAFAAAAVAVCIAAPTGGDDLTTLTERLDELAREKARVQQKLRGVKERQRQVTRQLASLDARVGEAEARLRRVNNSVRVTKVELREATAQCEEAEARLVEQKTVVAKRLVAVYERGQTRPLEVLLQSASFADFANRLYLLNEVIGRDAELLQDFDEARTEASTQREELSKRYEDLAALESRISAEKRRNTGQLQEAEREKQRLLRDRVAWERALAELEQDSREIEAMLQRVQHTPEGRERLAKPWTGKFGMPVEGRITSGYGYRRHPVHRVRKLHTGMDIAAPTGTPIRCGADGTVVHASRWGGYGNCIIVDHAGGLATLYAHCSRLAVTKGQAVTEGQVIGYVGSTGLSTGPHLHFEVRRDGRPTDPKPFLQ
jgi:murein DD-endopeptidase MepM/ murein hydrolase activator NlpD